MESGLEDPAEVQPPPSTNAEAEACPERCLSLGSRDSTCDTAGAAAAAPHFSSQRPYEAFLLTPPISILLALFTSNDNL